jgi:hypothetical protein
MGGVVGGAHQCAHLTSRSWATARSVIESTSHQNRGGVTRETWSIQELPDGSALVLVWFECPDVDKVFAEGAQDSSEFSIWFRGRVKEITGVDLTEQPEGGPELALDWSA